MIKKNDEKNGGELYVSPTIRAISLMSTAVLCFSNITRDAVWDGEEEEM